MEILKPEDRLLTVIGDRKEECKLEGVSRVKIICSEDLHYTIYMERDGSLCINKQDYEGDRSIRITPNAANQIYIK